MIKGSCIIGQSGGPTAVINASLAGVIFKAKQVTSITNIYGAINGVAGALSENLVDLSNISNEALDLLKITPGAALGSVRYFMHDFDSLNEASNDYHKLLEVFKKYNVRYFYYIGGNDSMDTCHKIAKFMEMSNYEVYVMGIPKTIDNDLEISDHTPGYGSAIKYISTTISEIYLDTNSYDKGRVTIVETMGRDAGWLAAGAGLASINNCGPDLIYLPEHPFVMAKFLKSVNEIYQQKRKVLVVVGENIKANDGEYLLEYRKFNTSDSFGHLQLGGVAQVLCEVVSKKLKLPVRAIELNLPERCAAHILSKTDMTEAYNCGVSAVDFSTTGTTDNMIYMKRISNSPYEISYETVALENVATLVKEVPSNFINDECNNITQDFIDYAKPLIQGEIMIPFKNGLPIVFDLKKYEK